MIKTRTLLLSFLIISLSSFLNNLSAQEFSFTVMSDSRGDILGVNKTVLTALTKHMIQNQPEADFLFFVGDYVDGSDDYPDTTLKHLKNWKKIMSPVYQNPNMKWPYIWSVIGNHEVRHPEDEDNFRSIFNDVFMNGPEDEKGLTYSFDYNNVHFVCLDSERWYYGDPDDPADDRRDWHTVQCLDWLKNDLEKARERNVRYIFVFGHEMPFPVGGHLHDGLPNLTDNLTLPLDSTRQWYLNQRDKLWDILVKNKITAYISGHEHLYGRQSVDNIYQIVAGSAGAPLYHFNPKYNNQPDIKQPGEEMSYSRAETYYQILNYNYGPGKNSQRSMDFVGYRAFHYVVFSVKENEVEVQMFGAPPKENTDDQMGGEIQLLDKFVISKE